MRKKLPKWERIGVVNVDAGLIWLGDPCYILHSANPDELAKAIGNSWSEFCDKLEDMQVAQFEHGGDPNNPGLGVCVSSGYGDGRYTVFVRRQDNRIKEVKIKFF